MNKEVMKEFQRVYQKISEIETEGDHRCSRCGISIPKGENYIKTIMKSSEDNYLSSEKTLFILCMDCYKDRRIKK